MKWATLGDYDRRTFGEGEKHAKIHTFVVHPRTIQPNPPSSIFEYDFAIAILEGCLEFTTNIQPVALPKSASATYEGKPVMIVGWGHLRYHKDTHELAGKHGDILQQATVTVFSNKQCKRHYQSFDPSYLMCAGDPKEWRKDACQDDSGGNLQFKILY